MGLTCREESSNGSIVVSVGDVRRCAWPADGMEGSGYSTGLYGHQVTTYTIDDWGVYGNAFPSTDRFG